MNDRLTVRLSGRIDRMETRIMPDGKRHVRLIDYKTEGAFDQGHIQRSSAGLLPTGTRIPGKRAARSRSAASHAGHRAKWSVPCRTEGCTRDNPEPATRRRECTSGADSPMAV